MGLIWMKKTHPDLYGTFIALVFFTPFLGGLIADRYLGYRRSIIMGGIDDGHWVLPDVYS